MERLGLVAGSLGGGGRRAYLAPVLFLAAATVTIGLLRGELRSHHTAAPPTIRAVRVHTARHVSHPKHVYYVVRAGDTLGAIATRTHVTLSRLIALNPKASPTALFIGEKLNLR